MQSTHRFGAILTVLAIGSTLLLAGVQAQSLQDFVAQRRAIRLQEQAGTTTTSTTKPTTTVAVPTTAEESARINAIARAQESVVSVIISKDLPVMEQYYQTMQLGNGFQVQVPRYRQNGTQSQQVGAGTAFFISSDGILMTNNHVVSDPKATYTVLMNNGEKIPATVVKTDAANDIALLKVDRQNMPALSFATATPMLGETAIAIGNALGEFRNTVSVGVVSGLQRSITADLPGQNQTETLNEIIQTDAAINSGNSGGPLIDLQGRVIGMNTATASDAQNIGFAIPAAALTQMFQGYHG